MPRGKQLAMVILQPKDLGMAVRNQKPKKPGVMIWAELIPDHRLVSVMQCLLGFRQTTTSK